ncbi:MAG: MFS transporter [Candidatus Kariarchaeaceae archaeon]
MSFYNSFIGINQLPEQAKGIMRKYGLIRSAVATVYSATGTIFILHIIDSIGFKEASMIMSIMFLTQIILDYPSGSLGDYIGQRWVLGIAYLAGFGGFYLFSIAQTFNHFMLAAVIFGFTNAQVSGSLQSWLDNNYKKIDDDSDPDRKNYGFTMNRFGSIDTFLMGISIMIGGVMATYWSREAVFRIQSFLILMIAFMVILLLTDLPDPIVDKVQKSQQSVGEYLSLLMGGISYVWSNKVLLFYLVGNSLVMTAWNLWGVLLLFPIYFGYSGSDSLAGILRSTIFFIGVGIQIITAKKTKDVPNSKLPSILLTHFLTLFLGVMALLYFIPVQNSFNILGFILLILVLTVSVSLIMPFIATLNQRISLDLVPSEHRNSIYSLLPTISGALGVVLLPVVGSLVAKVGMISGLVIALSLSMIGSLTIYLALYRVDHQISLQLFKKPIAIGAGD